jgi:hypothetical protein
MTPDQKAQATEVITTSFSFPALGVDEYDKPVMALAQMFSQQAAILFQEETDPAQRDKSIAAMELAFLHARESFLRKIRTQEQEKQDQPRIVR